MLDERIIKAGEALEAAKEKINERYRLGYHIMAPANWINDPNGLIQYKGEYHVFYQHHPYDENWGPMHWGHVKSKDCIHWEHCPVAIAPGDEFDKGGCFSGSAVDNNGELTLIYTGHNYIDEEQNTFYETQNIAVSKVIKVNITTLRLEVDYINYGRLCEVVRSVGGKVRVLEGKGLIFLLGKMKKRYSIVIAVVVFFAIIYFLSTYIWSIDITVGKNVTPFEIREQLKEIGVSPGVRKSSLDEKEIERKLESLNSEILWLRVRVEGSTLKVVTYTEAGVQDAATPTYVPTGDVMQLINSDPNIIQKAKNALVQRYMANQESVRTPINSAINGSGEDGQENLKTKVEESITNSKENRKKYLDSLGGDY